MLILTEVGVVDVFKNGRTPYTNTILNTLSHSHSFFFIYCLSTFSMNIFLHQKILRVHYEHTRTSVQEEIRSINATVVSNFNLIYLLEGWGWTHREYHGDYLEYFSFTDICQRTTSNGSRAEKGMFEI